MTAERIVFSYANDLWTARHDGSAVQRLTSHAGVEAGPQFSPDGSLVAFTGRIEGNLDVYVVPSGGGVPKRLTWHPGDDVVLGFTPDGTSILFSSARDSHTRRVGRRSGARRGTRKFLGPFATVAFNCASATWWQ